MKRLCVLGSTGSIGRQTLDVVKGHPELFKVVSLSANQNVDLIAEQIHDFSPDAVAVTDMQATKLLRSRVDGKIPVLGGTESLVELVQSDDVDVVVNGLVGSVGLHSTLAAIRAHKILALANKESMVAGGMLVRKALNKHKTSVIPVDSEHNAIFQCLIGEDPEKLKRIILTGSGGPFRGRMIKDLKNVTPKEALAHPRWNMGKKISIDSATLMNKGLEVIEAHFLFGVDYGHIEVVIHPQSIIHSMVEFIDRSIKAHLGQTDMRIPIQYAISFPERISSPLPSIDFIQLRELSFERPNLSNFPCLKYAFKAGREGKTYPAVLNAANEEAVAAFLGDMISFTSISEVIEDVLSSHNPREPQSIDDIIEVEIWARQKARELVASL